jgi:hypothetical protein
MLMRVFNSLDRSLRLCAVSQCLDRWTAERSAQRSNHSLLISERERERASFTVCTACWLTRSHTHCVSPPTHILRAWRVLSMPFNHPTRQAMYPSTHMHHIPTSMRPHMRPCRVASRPSNYTAFLAMGGVGLDTAYTYTTQPAVGEAIRASGLSRDKVSPPAHKHTHTHTHKRAHTHTYTHTHTHTHADHTPHTTHTL